MKRDVIVIGGGLSGLAAAYALEQQQIHYTLIEVKRRLGGSIHSVQKAGFWLDSGALALADTLDADWLGALGVQHKLYSLREGVLAFRQGTGTLVEALAAKITAPRLMRMAVSSVGELENGRYGVCLENGLLLDARALIVALPARYAERLFYSSIPALSAALRGYHYDSVYRVSLGYRSVDVPPALPNLRDMAYAFVHRTDEEGRVPAGHTLLQIGLRIDPQRQATESAMVELLQAVYQLPAPLVSHVGYWAEADPISCYDDAHAQWVRELRASLPPAIALIGSDYALHPPSTKGVARLDERIAQGTHAARQVSTAL